MGRYVNYGVLACAFVSFLFFDLLLKHEGRVFSDGVVQPGFVCAKAFWNAFSSFCQRRTWGGRAVFFSYTKKTLLLFWPSLSCLCAKSVFLFFVFLFPLFLLLFLHMMIWWVLV